MEHAELGRHHGEWLPPASFSLELCQVFEPLQLEQELLQVDEISGGITNLLWKLTPKLESGLAPVVARVFGEQTDLLIDRPREKEVVLQLNQAGFGAPVRAPASCMDWQRCFPACIASV